MKKLIFKKLYQDTFYFFLTSLLVMSLIVWTLQAVNYFDFVTEDILEVFPSLKVEEVLICFKHIRQGKYDLYGTLCTGSIIKSLHAYEEKYTTPFREQKHAAQEPYINGMIDWKQLGEALTVDQPSKLSLEEWLKRK